jgi:hypothetical protein
MANMATTEPANPVNNVNLRPILSALHPPKKAALSPPIPQQETAAAATFCGTPRLIRKKERNGKAMAPMRLTSMPDHKIQKSAGNPPTVRCQSRCRFMVNKKLQKRNDKREQLIQAGSIALNRAVWRTVRSLSLVDSAAGRSTPSHTGSATNTIASKGELFFVRHTAGEVVTCNQA